MQTQQFEEQLKEKTEYVQKVIHKYRMKEESASPLLSEAMNYSLESPGKRLRPIFLYEAYRFMGGEDLEVVEPFMAAIEMIHSYSLVHDDLPAMDNDEYRRGRKTTHVVYGEDIAILAGDGLLNYAFETAMKAFSGRENNAGILRALGILVSKPSVEGMIGGQALDVASCGKELSEETLRSIYLKKTGALLSCSMMAGAALAGASEEAIALFEEVGEKTGLAFQIRDDILDVESTTRELGKPVHSDEKNCKTTFVTLMGLEEARQETERYSREALEAFEKLKQRSDTNDGEFFEALVKSLVHRRK